MVYCTVIFIFPDISWKCQFSPHSNSLTFPTLKNLFPWLFPDPWQNWETTNNVLIKVIPSDLIQEANSIFEHYWAKMFRQSLFVLSQVPDKNVLLDVVKNTLKNLAGSTLEEWCAASLLNTTYKTRQEIVCSFVIMLWQWNKTIEISKKIPAKHQKIFAKQSVFPWSSSYLDWTNRFSN